MKTSLTDALCTCCGLCCDGSLFADVELAGRDETSTLEFMGLEIEDPDADDEGLLLQPCNALKGKRCSIYAHRPDCCRTFECRLLQEVMRGAVRVDRAQARIADALQRVERVRELLVQLGQTNANLPLKERCMEVLAPAGNITVHPETNRKRAELRAAMTSVERLIEKTFLGG